MKISAKEITAYLERLFPVTRSITGNGNRQTLDILKDIIPLTVHEYKTGTKVYDWIIPSEWNITDAWIKNASGQKIIDFKKSNLHIVSYSIPFKGKMKLAELKEHLHYLQEQPDVIPYRTSYYKEYWGFCTSYNDYLKLFNENEEYEIFIDTELRDGSLTLADYMIKGNGNKEYLFSTYFCHPSMANDNLSGVLLGAFLARELSGQKLKNSYRFIFAPETIGVITYCAMNEKVMKASAGGYILTCLAGQGPYGYKKSFVENHLVDRAAFQTFKETGIEPIIYPFIPQGSDERQYSSPGFRIPVGSIHKDKYHEYACYHTSKDDLSYLSIDGFIQTLNLYLSIINKLENNVSMVSNNPNCEPQLGRRGLYPSIGRRTMHAGNAKSASENTIHYRDELDIILWLLFYADGKHSLLDIAEKHHYHFEQLLEVAKKLEEKELIKLTPFE